MKFSKTILLFAFILILQSCSSSKFTIQNADNTAVRPAIENESFKISEYAQDKKYGYEKSFPINIGFDNERFAERNIQYFFNALQGQNGEKISYKKVEDCCPFATKRSQLGAGMLAIYEVSIENSSEKILLYFNIYDKGKLLCPKGFSIKK